MEESKKYTYKWNGVDIPLETRLKAARKIYDEFLISQGKNPDNLQKIHGIKPLKESSETVKNMRFFLDFENYSYNAKFFIESILNNEKYSYLPALLEDYVSKKEIVQKQFVEKLVQISQIVQPTVQPAIQHAVQPSISYKPKLEISVEKKAKPVKIKIEKPKIIKIKQPRKSLKQLTEEFFLSPFARAAAASVLALLPIAEQYGQEMKQQRIEQEKAKYHSMINHIDNVELAEIEDRGMLMNIQNTDIDRILKARKKDYVPDSLRYLGFYCVCPLDIIDIKSFFGRRVHPILGGVRPHKGIDLDAPFMAPVRAVAPGTITRRGWLGGYGFEVEIDHGNGWKTRYAHLFKSDYRIYEGKTVEEDEIIGYVGQSGLATGPHTHFEIHYKGNPVNPRWRIKRKEDLNELTCKSDGYIKDKKLVNEIKLDYVAEQHEELEAKKIELNNRLDSIIDYINGSGLINLVLKK